MGSTELAANLGGTMPENLPTEENIKRLETKENKKLSEKRKLKP